MAKIVIRIDVNNLMMRSRYYLTMELGLVQKKGGGLSKMRADNLPFLAR